MNVMSVQKKRSKDFEAGYKKGREVGIHQATIVNVFQFIQYLGDKRGWKRERIFDAILWIHKTAECVVEDLTTFPEIMEAVKEEYGIVLDGDKFCLLSEKAWEEVKSHAEG